MKTVQQSGSCTFEISKVPILRAMAMISSLSSAISGRSTARVAASSMQRRLSSVWLATWPRLSPVISTS